MRLVGCCRRHPRTHNRERVPFSSLHEGPSSDGWGLFVVNARNGHGRNPVHRDNGSRSHHEYARATTVDIGASSSTGRRTMADTKTSEQAADAEQPIAAVADPTAVPTGPDKPKGYNQLTGEFVV